MRIRKLVATSSLLVVLAAGGATGVAAADPPRVHAGCRAVTHQVSALETLADSLVAKGERLMARRDAAEAAGRNRLVAQIDASLARNDTQKARVADRIGNLEDWLDAHCSTEPPGQV